MRRRKAGSWDGWPLGLFTDTLIAANVGCTPQAVSHVRRERGIPALRLRRVELSEALAGAARGETRAATGRRHGVSGARISQLLRESS